MNTTSQRSLSGALLLGLVAAVLCRYFWSYFYFGVPLGYDVGMYRYLFTLHAEALPPFSIGDVQDWAKDHPLGLFIVFTPFIKLGVPVDWVIGWIWNALNVALVVLLAWTISRSALFTKQVRPLHMGIAVLVAALLSLPLYDGFAFMLYKTIGALFWMVLTYALLERKSYWAIATGILTLVTHNQTGLLFGLSIALWWGLEGVYLRGSKHWWKYTGIGIAACIVALLIYLPVLYEAIGKHIAVLLHSIDGTADAGAFPSITDYAPRYSIMMALSSMGFLLHIKYTKRITYWHTTVFWCAVFIVLRLFFFKRFLLQLDFFLLPFAAYGLLTIWNTWQKPLLHAVLVGIVVIQGYFTVQHMQLRTPRISLYTYQAVQQLPEIVPETGVVYAFENYTPLWLRGWLPHARVVAPGFFEPSFVLSDWEYFLDTQNQNYRKIFLGRIHTPLFIFLSDEFFLVHSDERYKNLITDPCFTQSRLIPQLWSSPCVTLDD